MNPYGSNFDGLLWYSSTLHCKHGLCFLDWFECDFIPLSHNCICDGNGAWGDFFLLYAAWVRSRAERPSVSYTKVVMEVAWTGHNLQCKKTN